MPAPKVPPELLPASLSANKHQRLIDCPYRFFTRDCLRLKPAEEISEALQKSDYGNRVHLCLHAFHGNVTGLPGPFGKQITKQNRAQAIALLEKIADAVFAKDLEDNFLHRGWRWHWKKRIPGYIDWQIDRNTVWRTHANEWEGARQLTENLEVTGRIDRVDQDERGQFGIIDYKTGRTPDQRAVDQGEAIQLTTYALLLDEVERVEYVQIGKNNRVKTQAHLEGEALRTGRQAARERLLKLNSQLRRGAPLPAWGDASVCQFCEMQGVCRKCAWEQ